MRNSLGVWVLALAACTPAGLVRSGADSQIEPSLASRGTSPHSESADAALAAFDRANPQCRMWTNWQSLCSRTGPGMTTFCKADPGYPVAPSEPFCVNRQVPLGTTYHDGQFDTRAQRRSRNRFCEVFAGEAGSRQEQIGTLPECDLYAAQRPFDGRRPEANVHPLCRQWRQVTPESAVVLGPDLCVAWDEALPCSRIFGNAYHHPWAGGDLILPTVRNYREQPVWGVYCVEDDAARTRN